MDLAGLVSALFAVVQRVEPSDGLALEQAVVDRLHGVGIRLESIPGGCRLFGFASESGLAHQLDLVAALASADAIIELKAHHGTMPKNELLRFKAVTDDYFIGLGRHRPRRPLYRVFAGPGRMTRGMRRYAALHGVALVEGDRWPSCMLASDRLPWSVDEAPSAESRRSIDTLVRSMDEVLRPVPSGYLAPAWPGARTVDAVLDLQDEWSIRRWTELDRGGPADDEAFDRWAA